jgi:Phage gp6-like head-tail connector protein
MAAMITLAEAKTQLRITDTWHDGEVQAAIDAADAAVRKRLKTANDPTWDELTAPGDIKHAVKLLTAHFYEHRGDAFGPDQDNDDRVWASVNQLIGMWRDPALA